MGKLVLKAANSRVKAELAIDTAEIVRVYQKKAAEKVMINQVVMVFDVLLHHGFTLALFCKIKNS